MPKRSAAPTCTPRSPAWPTTSPRTTRTRCRSRATSSATSTAQDACRSPCSRRANRCIRRSELYGIVPKDTRRPFDIREVIARVVDGSEFHEFKARYGKTLVTGFAHIHGYPVGIVANNGILFAESRAQGRALHRAVQPARHPAGVPAEHHRLHGRPQVRERRHRQGRREDGDRGGVRARAQVHRGHRRQLRRRQLRHVRPRLRPRFLWMWPNARISVMGGEQAASVLATVKRDGIEAAARPGRRKRKKRSRRRSASSTKRRATPTTPPRGCGTTASSIRPTRAACWAWRCRPASMRRSRTHALRRVPDVSARTAAQACAGSRIAM